VFLVSVVFCNLEVVHRADHSSRGVLLCVCVCVCVCMSVILKLKK